MKYKFSMETNSCFIDTISIVISGIFDIFEVQINLVTI